MNILYPPAPATSYTSWHPLALPADLLVSVERDQHLQLVKLRCSIHEEGDAHRAYLPRALTPVPLRCSLASRWLQTCCIGADSQKTRVGN